MKTILALLLICAPVFAGPPSWSVRICCYDDKDNLIDSKGSGSLITSQHVITNYHVINDARKIFVRFNDFTHIEANVTKKDKNWDLALLRLVADTKRTTAPLGTITTIGQRVWIGGYGQGLFSEGYATIKSFNKSKREEQKYPFMFAKGHSAIPGDSGGPVTDKQGNLVGVIFGADRKGNSTGIVRIEYVREFLRRN